MVSLEKVSKVEYLKREYKIYLDNDRKKLLTNHFRFYRSLKPNELENQLLKQQLLYFLPNYKYFKNYMDGPTKELAIFIENTFDHTVNDEKEIIENKFNELKEFSAQIYKEYYGEQSLDNV